MTVRSFLDLSTAHLRPEDLQELSRLHNTIEFSSILMGIQGVMVWVGYCDWDDFSDPLRAILKKAKEDFKVDYVMFDADAGMSLDFENYEALWS